jgi:predicted AlkP superfamily phosphohydrolase/phosphomutase
MSDHGFTGREATFSPNQWLVERGDLVVETSSVQRTMNRGGLTKQRLKSSLRSMGLLELARRIVPASIRQRYIPNDDGSTDITKATIDWTETKAVSLGHGPIYVNEQAFAGPSAVESYRNQLKSDLQSVRTPEGRPLVEAVHKAESIYEDAIGFPPDFIVEYRPGVDASNVDVFGPVFGGTTRWTGVHRQTGLFAAIGSGVVSSSTHLAIDDIAPTILHYLDEPIPNDMDGSPELTIFSEPLSDRSPRSCSPVSRRSDVAGSSAADVKDRLEDLGYL